MILTQLTKRRKTKIGVNVPHDRSSWYANFQLQISNVRIRVVQCRRLIDRRIAAFFVDTGPDIRKKIET